MEKITLRGVALLLLVFFQEIKTAKYEGQKKLMKCFSRNTRRDGYFVDINVKEISGKLRKYHNN
jgi:hypothetical protein